MFKLTNSDTLLMATDRLVCPERIKVEINIKVKIIIAHWQYFTTTFSIGEYTGRNKNTFKKENMDI